MEGAGFLALVIGVPLIVLILLICLCCWCCHCCCCARNTQQVVVLPQSNPTSTVINTTLMTPYSQGYAPLPPGPGFANPLSGVQQQFQPPPTAVQFSRQRDPDDQMLHQEYPPKGRQNEFHGPIAPESYPEDGPSASREPLKPPPYSAQQ